MEEAWWSKITAFAGLQGIIVTVISMLLRRSNPAGQHHMVLQCSCMPTAATCMLIQGWQSARSVQASGLKRPAHQALHSQICKRMLQAHLKDHSEATAGPKGAVDPGHDLASQQRVATNGEEVGCPADGFLLEHLHGHVTGQTGAEGGLLSFRSLLFINQLLMKSRITQEHGSEARADS